MGEAHKPSNCEPCLRGSRYAVTGKLKTSAALLRYPVGSFLTRRDTLMDVSVKPEHGPKHTWAVYVDDTCIARGLPRAEANRIRMQIQRGELKPRLS